MPIPSNSTSATATVIGQLPYEAVQTDIHFGGITYSVWFKYTAVAVDKIIGLRFYGDAVTYKPSVTTYIDDDVTILGGSGANLMSQIPTLTGRTYYFKVTPNAGNPTPATLNISILRAQDYLPAPAGSIFIRAASILSSFQAAGYTGLGAGFVNVNDGEIYGFEEQFEVGESGDYLPTTGQLLFGDEYTSPYNKLKLYTPDLTLIADVIYSWRMGHPIIRTSREQALFYVGSKGVSPSFPIEYVTVTATGVLSSPVVMTGFGMTAIANSQDNLFVYVVGVGGSTNSNVKKWNKATSVFDADFSVIVANHVVQDILVMVTGEVVILYHESATDSIFVRIYNAAGTLLLTYTVPAVSYTSQAPRLGYANDNSLSFWLYLHKSDGFSNFINIQLSDVSVLKTILTPSSDYFNIENPNPAYRFIVSDTCPLVIILSTGINISSSNVYKLITSGLQKHDTLLNNNSSTDVKIPTPFFKTALIGD